MEFEGFSNMAMTLLILFVLVLSGTTTLATNETNRIPLYIGGFLAGSPAPETCVKHANEIEGILDGYELFLRLTDTPRNIPGLMLLYLHEYIYKPPVVLGIIGPTFSDLCIEMNEVASYYGINQVTSATSPSLKDRDKYPLAVQSYYETSILTPAKVALIKSMGWRRVAMVNERVDSFLQTSQELTLLLIQEGVSVLANEIVTDVDDSSEQIKSLLRQDARIIFIEMYAAGRIKFLCQAYKHGLWGSKYVWFLPGFTQHNFWVFIDTVPCTLEEINEFISKSHFIDLVPAIYPNLDTTTVNFNGLRLTDHQLTEASALPKRLFYGLRYDSCMALVLALNGSMSDLAAVNRSLEDFQYSDFQIANIINANLLKVNFIGLTGSMSFNSDGTRSSDIAVRGHMDTNGISGGYDAILIYSISTKYFRTVANRTFFWHNGFPPVDGKTEILQATQINRLSRIALYTLTTFGIFLSLIFTVINVVCRNKRAIKISSPKLNNFILCGSLLLYTSIFLFGQDTSNLSDKFIFILCKVRLAFVCIGFSMSFGALFMKTYRIHVIFHKAVQKFQHVRVSDSKLILGIMIPVLIDVLILGVLISVTDSRISTHRFEPELDIVNPEAEVFIVPIVEFCTSSYQLYFSVAIYGVKAVLLTFGVFLAWETRNIIVSELNDSKYIAMSVYTVAVILTLLIPSLNLIFYDVNLYFIILATALVFINTIVLCLVFLPKVLLLWKSRGKDIRITMMSESNMTFDTTTGVAVNKLVKRKKEELQAILYEKQQRLKSLRAACEKTMD